MSPVDTFDRLVSQLSIQERQDMFRRLEAKVPVSAAPLYSQETLPEDVILEKRFRETSFLLKLYLRVLSFFKHKPVLDLFEERLVLKLGMELTKKVPTLFDYNRSVFLGGMHEALLSLKLGARFFYDTLDNSFIRDKASFLAFLASTDMPDIHQKLTDNTDPMQYIQMNPQASEQDVRQAISRELEAAFDQITEAQKKIMYHNVRSLLCLKELAAFLFDRTLTAFSGSDDEKTAPAYLLTDKLFVLDNILFSLSQPPPLSLLEALFVFSVQDKLEEEHFDMAEEMKNRMVAAQEALAKIRDFNETVPLTTLLRYCSRKLSYLPSPITGGEDWFVIFRDFWRKRVDAAYIQFIKNRRKDRLEVSLSALFGTDKVPSLELFHSDTDGGIKIRHQYSLSFLLGFARHVLGTNASKILNNILLNGDFYKKENKQEYAEAYNGLLTLERDILNFQKKVSLSGEFGKRYLSIKNEITAVPLKRQKYAMLQMDVDQEGAELTAKTTMSLRSLSQVLGGILHGEVGGKYDGLANFGDFAGRSIASFNASLGNTLQKIDKAVQLLGEIETLESGR